VGDMVSNLYSCSCKVPILVKLELSRQIFEKHSNFMKIFAGGADLFQADRHDAANCSSSQFCERAYKQYFYCVRNFCARSLPAAASCHLFCCAYAVGFRCSCSTGTDKSLMDSGITNSNINSQYRMPMSRNQRNTNNKHKKHPPETHESFVIRCRFLDAQNTWNNLRKIAFHKTLQE